MSKAFGSFRRSYPTLSKAQRKKRRENRTRIWQEFSQDALRRVCEMPERDFAAAFGLEVTETPTKFGDPDFYAFKDNGSNILAVAHLDTVVDPEQRKCGFLDTADGMVVYSGALDDRLGAYIILELLPRLGINVDVLLTTGEECSRSTAQHFDPPEGKEYDWLIEFDRGGTDVVMYQYETPELVKLVEDSGAPVGVGSFSDIAYLEHLGAAAFNWGVGYQDYHGPRSHAFLDDTFNMLAYFIEFHATNAGTYLPHEEEVFEPISSATGGGWGAWLGDDDDAEQSRHERRIAEMTDEEWAEYETKLKATYGLPKQPPLPIPTESPEGDEAFEARIAGEARAALDGIEARDYSKAHADGARPRSVGSLAVPQRLIG